MARTSWKDVGARAHLSPGGAALAGFVVLILGAMVVPLPPWLLDILLSFNITAALLLLLVGLSSRGVASLGSLPSLLLLTTLFRLSLNVGSTRLILLHGDAGEVIEAFGGFVVQGNYVVGGVVFLILTLVQFLVIAKGSERVAEVAARFSLDAMPGRQMSIDADLRAGVLTLDEARNARAALQRESGLYGAMDGAMKFVKGDAIAGVVITLINVLGGLIVGVGQRGMDVSEAARVYTLLTIGDGLVSQLPALLVATASGVIITRTRGAGEHLGDEIFRELSGHPGAFWAASALLTVLGAIPGLPALPFWFLGVFAAFAGWSLGARKGREEARTSGEVPCREAFRLRASEGVRGLLERALLERWEVQRAALEEAWGVPVPPLRWHEGGEGGEVALSFRGIPMFRVACNEEDPVETANRLVQVLREYALGNLADLLGPQEVKDLLNELRKRCPADVEAATPEPVPLISVVVVLQELLREGVPVRDLRTILLVLGREGRKESGTGALVEYVRRALWRSITWSAVEGGESLEVFSVDAEVEEMIRSSVRREEGGERLVLSKRIRQEILGAFRRVAQERPHVAFVLTAPATRPHIRDLLLGAGVELRPLSFEELDPSLKIVPAASVSVGRR